MPTSFDEIIDIALVTVRDYKLDKLFNQSEQNFITYCDGFLVSAIPNFTQCQQSLSYNLENREFEVTLTELEKRILSDLWVIAWWEKELQDASQIQAKLQVSSSFTSHSAAQNLKEKATYLDGLREKVRQKITDYQLQNILNQDAFKGW